jgi:hypothetical protein
MLAVAPLMAEASEVLRGPSHPPLTQKIVLTRSAHEIVRLATPFLPVGNLAIGLGVCTATWLGEQDGHTYLLTAAHCLRSRAATAMRVQASFDGWDHRVLAEGNGWAFIPPAAVGIDGDLNEAVDVAVLKLPTRDKATDDVGRPLEQPLLDDLRHVFPGLLHDDTLWARTAPGDSGSAWWQAPMGYWAFVATTSGGESRGDAFHLLGPRLLNHIDWLRSVYPGVRTLRDRLSVEIDKPFVSRGDEGSGISGGVYFTVPEKNSTRGGPASASASDQTSISVVRTVVQEERTGERIEIKLHVTRRAKACGVPIPTIDGITTHAMFAVNIARDLVCRSKPQSGPLVVSFQEEDKASMAAGIWTGRVDVEARSVSDGRLIERIPVHVRLNRTASGLVTESKGYLSPDLVALLPISPGSKVAISLPRQPGVQGSDEPWKPARLSDVRIIELTARDVLNRKDINVRLRAFVLPTCSPGPNKGISQCSVERPYQLSVGFMREDNPALAAGLYRGSFLIKVGDPASPSTPHALLKIAVNLDTL